MKCVRWHAALNIGVWVWRLFPSPLPRCWRKRQRGGGEDDEDNVSILDTVRVAGIRSSLQKSQVIKQDFIGTVDAISAEDIGKFPDQNVADALQRVPGVSVNRTSGESRYITVRGFGPQFNVATLNGRVMATDAVSRGFSFDILPSELISTVEVQKTSMADAPEGSIGATVNIRTRRPLDDPGLHVAASVEGTYDDTTSNIGPKVSALISHTNADRTLGGLLSAVHYKRSHITEFVTTSGWVTGTSGVSNGITGPRGMDYQVNRSDRTRNGINAAFAWHPSETVKLDVDAMYSRYKVDVDGYGSSFYILYESIIDITADENGTATWSRSGPVGDGLTASGNVRHASGTRDSTNRQLGAHLNWQVGEYTALDVDGSWSKADNNPDPRKVYYSNINHIYPGLTPEWNLNPGGFPYYSNLTSPSDASLLMTGYFNRNAELVNDELAEFKTHLTRNFYDGTLSRLQFGVSGATRTKDRHVMRTLADLENAYSFPLALVPYDLVEIFHAGNVAGAGGMTQWLSYDPVKYYDWLASEAAWGQFLPGGTQYDPRFPDKAQRVQDLLAQSGGGINALPRPQDYWEVREANYAAFAMADFEGDWGAMPWKLNVGVRYIRTDITSKAISTQIKSITVLPVDYLLLEVEYTDPMPLTKRSSYHDWLPSLNFRLNLRDDLVLRASASETVTRPGLSSLSAGERFFIATPNPGVWTTNNPDLKPYNSKNVDLGLEWYVNDASYIALAGFYRNVSNFISTVTVPATILDLPFLRTMPVNADSAIVKGAEFAFQYTFDHLPTPFDGFGVQLNYTWVDSQQTFDPSIATGQFAVEGLSDSGNLVLFYEKDRFGMRVAYNWRDEYLESIRGAQGEPTTVNAYEQIDLSANFRLNDTLSIFANATNLTGQTISSWQRYRSRPLSMFDYGRTLSLGIRGKW